MRVSAEGPPATQRRHIHPRVNTVLRRAGRTPAGVLGMVCLFLAVAVALLADTLAPGDPLAAAGPALRPPSAEHLMGTDNFGRDILAAVVHGVCAPPCSSS